MTLLELYLIFTLPEIKAVAFGISVGAGMCFLLGAAANMISATESSALATAFGKSVSYWFRVATIILIISLPISIFTPSAETMRWMIGGYIVTNIEGIEKLPPNLVNMANRFLEEYGEGVPE